METTPRGRSAPTNNPASQTQTDDRRRNAREDTRRALRRKAVSIFVCGLGIGWLMGLSASPVLAIVLASILAIISGIVSLMVGIDKQEEAAAEEHTSTLSAAGAASGPLSDKLAAPIPPRPRRRVADALKYVDPSPLAVLIVGLAIGSAAGTVARTNELLGAWPAYLADKWKNSGMNRAEIKKRLFDNLYPPSKPASEGGKTESGTKTESGGSSAASSSHLGVLFAVSLEECERFKTKKGEDLRQDMASGSDNRVALFAQNCKDTMDLSTAVDELICPTVEVQEKAKSVAGGGEVNLRFNISAEECRQLHPLRGQDLQRGLLRIHDTRVAAFTLKCRNLEDLQTAFENLICPEKAP